MVGMLLTGVFANQAINAANETSNGLIFGETTLFLVQAAALVGVSAFAFAGAWLLLRLTHSISPLRVSIEEEIMGLDQSQHDESTAF
jgi:Amt family ammonium transporter